MAIIDSLTSYWKFEEAAGDAIDSHGANDGTVTGCTYQETGKIDDCYDYDGNDVVDISTCSINGNADFSVNMWIKPDDITIRYFIGLKKDVNNFTQIRLKDANELTIYWKIGGVHDTDDVAGFTFGVGDWTMITIVYDYSESQLYLYQDGSFVDNKTAAQGIGTLATNMIGADPTKAAFFDGDIDETGVWAKKLSSTEVTSLWNGGSGLAYPFLVVANSKINIGDTWKDINKIQINIGDAWKEVNSVKINIGDAWKTIF